MPEKSTKSSDQSNGSIGKKDSRIAFNTVGSRKREEFFSITTIHSIESTCLCRDKYSLCFIIAFQKSKTFWTYCLRRS